MRTWRWFISSRIRRATEACNHIETLFRSQQDILSPSAVADMEQAIAKTRETIRSGGSSLDEQIETLEKTTVASLKPYPFSNWRENVEMLLVAIAVACGVRTFFAQPFKIPTGSMQPTFYGIMVDDLRQSKVPIPHGFQRFADAIVHGTFYTELIAEDEGEAVALGPPMHFLGMIHRQTVTMQYPSRTKTYTLWCTPDEDGRNTGLFLDYGRHYQKGDAVVKMKEVTGDHLFVDRVTYNFRHPARGEVIVFKTAEIHHPQVDTNQFYVKRLVGLPNEQLQISSDRHLVVNGEPLTAATLRFESVYSFHGTRPNERYTGHGPNTGLFATTNTVVTVPPHGYMAMGDNTDNSLDSRYWGAIPEKDIIGKAFFIYWPISNHGLSRFGWGQR